MVKRHQITKSQFLFRDLDIGRVTIKQKLEPIPNRDKYYRFRTSKRELEILKENKKILKEKFGLNLSDVLRYFSLNCDNHNLLWHLGLMDITDKHREFKFEAL